MAESAELSVTTTAIPPVFPNSILSIQTESHASPPKPDKEVAGSGDEHFALQAGDVPIVALSEAQLVNLLQKKFDASLDGNGHVPRFREVFNQTLFSRKRVATDKTDLHCATFCARFRDGSKSDICPPTPAGYTCNCEICRVTTRLLLHFSGLSGSKHKLTRVGGTLREQSIWSNGSVNSLGVKGSYSRHTPSVTNGVQMTATKQQGLTAVPGPDASALALLDNSRKRPRLRKEDPPSLPPVTATLSPEEDHQKQQMIAKLPPSALITVTRTMPDKRPWAAAAIRSKIHEFTDAELAKLIDTDGVSLETLVLASAEQDRRRDEGGGGGGDNISKERGALVASGRVLPQGAPPSPCGASE